FNGWGAKRKISSIGFSNILRLCLRMLQQRTINTAADLQQSRVQKRGKIPHTFPFEASGIPEGSGTVLLRCLIDRGSVKSDSLFCSLSGDLPCHASPVSRTR
uniref:Uncharacterized protein n=1 Tax=Amphilophus citrinellus TaxID=61819 RepID=A0A3Q0R6L4_AMPCI